MAEGACTAIMGPSGSGKSTLLKVAAGLMVPDRGTVTLRGEDLAAMSERRLLAFRKTNGFVFQDGALWENKTIFDNLALPLQVHFPELGERGIAARVLRDARARRPRRLGRPAPGAALGRRAQDRGVPARGHRRTPRSCSSTSPRSRSTT